jgi:hypothetical protein
MNTSSSQPHDWFEQQQDRQELADAVNKLGRFIDQYSPLPSERSRILALAILENGETSGVVSAARAARLLAESDS